MNIWDSPDLAPLLMPNHNPASPAPHSAAPHSRQPGLCGCLCGLSVPLEPVCTCCSVCLQVGMDISGQEAAQKRNRNSAAAPLLSAPCALVTVWSTPCILPLLPPLSVSLPLEPMWPLLRASVQDMVPLTIGPNSSLSPSLPSTVILFSKHLLGLLEESS